jgi:hypothetical protein
VLAVAGAHILTHQDLFHVTSPGLEDLLIGYPTAGLLLIVAAIIAWPRHAL